MIVCILCGGKGTRLGGTEEEIPKPLVKIDKFPIVRHVMSSFYKDGWKKFILLTGHKSEMIDKWVSESRDIPKTWKVGTYFTGNDALTGDRIRQVFDILDEPFFLTYGDGISNVDTVSLLEHHWTIGNMMTMTVVHPPSRFGRATLNGNSIYRFDEKNKSTEWINGGFMVLEPGMKIFWKNKPAGINFEKEIVPQVAESGNLTAFKHEGFWQCMDTPRDVQYIRELCDRGDKIWMRKLSGEGKKS